MTYNAYNVKQIVLYYYGTAVLAPNHPVFNYSNFAVASAVTQN